MGAQELRGAHLMRFQLDLGAGLAVDIAHCDDRLAGPAAVEVLLGEEQAAAKARRGLRGHCPGGEKGRQGLAELREAGVGISDLDAAFGLASQVKHDPEGLEPFSEGLVLLGLGAKCPAQEPEYGVDYVGDVVGRVSYIDDGEIIKIAGGDQEEELAGHGFQGLTAAQKSVH